MLQQANFVRPFDALQSGAIRFHRNDKPLPAFSIRNKLAIDVVGANYSIPKKPLRLECEDGCACCEQLHSQCSLVVSTALT